MNSYLRAGTVAALFLLLGSSPVRAQTGSITGTIVDAESGESLIGANIIIKGTAIGATTDLDGHFTIKRVKPGSYDVVVSYIGFHPITVLNVEVRAGAEAIIHLILRPEAVGMGEVLVEATAIRNSEGVLLRDRQKAAAVSDAISAELISQTGGGNAAHAMSKVTGASVVGGKYVYVRGLGGRYSNAQLNSASLPSADPDKNAAQLDLFPANLLDNIVATKTFTPDRPGNFSGGSININTKAFPESLTFRVSNSVAYNSEVTLSENFMTGPVGDSDWLGFDGSSRGIPELLRDESVVIPRVSQARRDAELAQQIDTYSNVFNGVMAPSAGQAGLDQSYSISFGNQFSLFGRPLGVAAGATYSREFGGYDDGRTAQFEATDPNADSLNVNFDFTDLRGEQQTSWGLLNNLTYRFDPHHTIGVNVLRTQDGEQLGRYQVGIYPKNTRPPVQFETYVLQYTERQVGSYQLRGNHFFRPLGELRADWNVALSNSAQDEPDLRFFFDQFVDVDLNQDGLADTTVYDINLGSSNATPPTRVFRSMEEDNLEANLNLVLPVNIGLSSAVQFKFGGSILRKDRSFRERKFNYRDNSIDFSDFGGNIEAFFSPENLGIVDESNGRYTFGNTIEEGTRAANNYDGTQDVSAIYAMVDAIPVRRLRVIAGARFESTDMEIVSRDSTKAPGEISEQDLLPSLSLVYEAAENMNLRASGTRTLARPTFREIAPFTSFSFAGGPELSGNPELERTLITNLDLRWEWFVNPGEVLAASGFYKYFRDPIEQVFVSNNNQVSFVNVPSATVYGVEFEARKQLGWIHRRLERLTAFGNVALIASGVDVPSREKVLAEGYDKEDTRPFQGQSPYVLNLGLAYENLESGTSASVAFNRFGERLSSVTLGGAPNIFEQPRNDLYLSVGQSFFRMLEVRLSIDNVLNSDFTELQRYKGGEFVTHAYDYGRTVKMSVSYNL